MSFIFYAKMVLTLFSKNHGNILYKICFLSFLILLLQHERRVKEYTDKGSGAIHEVWDKEHNNG